MLIFALVFAILQKVRIMGGEAKDNKGVNTVIAISIALLALQFDEVPLFFQIFFPKVGIGLSIILGALIFLGLFVDFHKSRGMAKLLLTIGGVVGIVVLLTSFDEYSWWTGSFWQYNLSAIVAGIIILIFVGIVVSSGSPPEDGGELFKGYKFQ